MALFVRPPRRLAPWCLSLLLGLCVAANAPAAPQQAGPPSSSAADVRAVWHEQARARNARGAVSRDAVVSAVDLCAPCTDGGQCVSSLCPVDANGNGVCLQACDAQGACPDNWECITLQDGTPVCYPNDATVCPPEYAGAKNTYCQLPATADNPNGGVKRQCAAGLTCYGFPADDGTAASQVGVCVTACSSRQATATCAPDETCCFDTAADRSCVTAPTVSRNVGGCFVLGDVGASCVAPDHSYCGGKVRCFTPNNLATSASCFGTCGDTSCPSGAYCVNFDGLNVCCNSRTLDLNRPTATCRPLQGICRREVGVACETSADCRLGLCQRNGNQSACSMTCASDADCPSADVDANGDGVPDGGGTCLNFGSANRCWPLNGPAAAPACATAQNVLAGDRHGCQCSGGSQALAYLAAPLALGWRRWRRRSRKDVN